MTPFLTLVLGSAVLGTIVASFINALSFRFNTGRSVMRGRSRCMHCGHTLSALDLVPLLSFLYLRGRCRYCNSRLSLQYPAVEAVGALLGILVFLAHPGLLGFSFWFVVWMVLLFITIYDIRHLIIPYSASGTLAALAVVFLLFPHLHPSVLSLLAGPLLALPLFLLSLVSGGRWMGWGDSTLEISLGWLLGLTAGLTAFVLAFWVGAVVGIALMLLSKRYTMRSEMPLGPFLIFGAAVAHFFHVDFFTQLPFLF